jgi:hypothetical protein
MLCVAAYAPDLQAAAEGALQSVDGPREFVEAALGRRQVVVQ